MSAIVLLKYKWPFQHSGTLDHAFGFAHGVFFVLCVWSLMCKVSRTSLKGCFTKGLANPELCES